MSCIRADCVTEDVELLTHVGQRFATYATASRAAAHHHRETGHVTGASKVLSHGRPITTARHTIYGWGPSREGSPSHVNA